jgi:hypothetical protein
MPDHPALRLSGLLSMDSQRRLLRPWVCGSLELTTCARRSSSSTWFSRREGPSAHFRTHVSDGSRFLPDTTGDVLLFLPLPLRPDVRSKEHASLFCLLASISLRITWARSPQEPPGEVRLSPLSTTTTAWELASQAALFCSQESKRGKCTPTLNRAENDSER